MNSIKMILVLLICGLSATAGFAQSSVDISVTHTEFIENTSAPNSSSTNNRVIYQEGGKFKLKDSSGNITRLEQGLDADKTVNFDNSMSGADMQALIDAQPKMLNGYILTFQFADGTYNLTQELVFYGFIGGLLNIHGNSSDNTLSTTKSVHLNGSGITMSSSVISVTLCSYARVNYLKITASAEATQSSCLFLNSCHAINSYFNYFIQPSNSASFNCLNIHTNASGQVSGCYFNGGYYGVYARGSTFQLSTCATTGTSQEYGVCADASLLSTAALTFTGNLGNTRTLIGGQIFN